jgi:adenylate cyclase
VNRRDPFTRPLRLHLSVLITLLLVGVAAPLIWLGYERGRTGAVSAAAEQMRLLTARTVDRYRLVFGDAVSVVAMASASKPFLTHPPDDLPAQTSFFLKGLAGSPYIDGIYVGYPNGSFVHAVSLDNDPVWREVLAAPADAAFALRVIVETAPGTRVSTWRFINREGRTIAERDPVPASYDSRTRPWYQSASTVQGTVSVGPYVMATTRALGLTISEGHQDDWRVVVGTDILLETISRFLGQERVSPRAQAYVFDRFGSLIIHSDEAKMDLILSRLAAGSTPGLRDGDSDDPILEAVRKALAQRTGDTEQIFRFAADGEAYVGQVSAIRFSPLLEGNTIVIAAPLGDFTAASDRLMRHGLIISAALLLLGILAAWMISALITRSLTSLTQQAVSLADLEFPASGQIESRVAEISSLATAFGAARDAIRTFARYVPRELVRKIVLSRQFSARGGVRQDVTILFTDIRDFTSMCEQHSPETVVELLSAYFELMHKNVEDNHGTIVQFLGDSIFAMWNAPMPDSAHVENGCRCALALAAAIAAFNLRQRELGAPEFVTRIGLHTGPAVVGSVGAEDRLQYTAMGDTVNVASRLEGMNKEFGTTILASRSVREQCGDRFEFRPLGVRPAKGRTQMIEIFELVRASE